MSNSSFICFDCFYNIYRFTMVLTNFARKKTYIQGFIFISVHGPQNSQDALTTCRQLVSYSTCTPPTNGRKVGKHTNRPLLLTR